MPDDRKMTYFFCLGSNRFKVSKQTFALISHQEEKSAKSNHTDVKVRVATLKVKVRATTVFAQGPLKKA